MTHKKILDRLQIPGLNFGIFHGFSKKSYFAVIDAVSFTILDKAWLPHFVPYSAHGMHFPEAKWTLQN